MEPTISTIKKEDFTFYIVEKNMKHYQELKEEEAKPNCGLMGKYLLFSDNPQYLYDAAKHVCLRFDLSVFAISNKDGNKGKFSYVCKIYDTSDKFSRLIPRYIDLEKIQYRYYKLESLSRKGIYSQQYINSLKTEKV